MHRFILLFLLMAAACETLPPADLVQTSLSASSRLDGDSLRITLANPSPIPMRIGIRAGDEVLEERFVLGPEGASTLAYHVADSDSSDIRSRLSYSFTMGDPAVPIRPEPLSWPFPRGRSSEIIQGYGGTFSHQSAYSRYALDFRMAPGDTVVAVDDGRVAGVIEGYDLHGDDPEYRPFANFITLYHPHSGLITQYVHLQYEGSFVAVGDTVRRGQPIGLAGRTGYTTVDHLHFNVLVPDSANAIVAFPVVFEGDVDGASLKRGDVVSHGNVNPD